MTLYTLSREAGLDIVEVVNYIAQDSLVASLRWEQRMIAALDHLANWPSSGRLRPEFTPLPLHFWLEGNYLVVYNKATKPLEIVAILHSARDVHGILFERFDDE